MEESEAVNGRWDPHVECEFCKDGRVETICEIVGKRLTYYFKCNSCRRIDTWARLAKKRIYG